MLDLDPRDWPAISALLDQALDLTPELRRSWLDALPQESARHRDTVARLLAAEGGPETDALLSRVPRFGLLIEDAAESGQAALSAGARVGPYVLLAPIGRGGMGSVWLAERVDGQPRRKVALKLPHLGWAPGLAERLARERDILASLAHPNIARLYDAGVDDLGRPYLALEHVDGTPINRYAAEHQLDTNARVGLVLQVAAAVAHAHAHLAVHRDLKPSNILVTVDGEVRLLDFGIAKLLQEGDAEDDTAELTRLHGPALTPDYASPEQIRGERVGTASDIYGLGIVAYELLAGVRPYHLDAKGAKQLADAIDAVQIQPASRCAVDVTVGRQLEGDLDAILNKALKKDAAERYLTVQAFAGDLERHLADQPVLARPDTVGYRLRKAISRNALQVGAAAVVTAALLAGTGISLWQAGEARHEARRAEQVKNFSLSIFRDADTDAGANAKTTAVDLLKAAEARIDSQLVGRPEIAVELMIAVGYGLLGQGLVDDAEKLLKRTLDRSRRELGAGDPMTLAASIVYGEVLVELDRNEEAIALLQPAVVDARRRHATHELIDALRWIGSAELNMGRFDAALESTGGAVAEAEAPDAGASLRDRFGAWQTYANALATARRPGLTDAARRALALARELQPGRVTEAELTARQLMAAGLAGEGHPREAIAELETVMAERIRSFGTNHLKVAVSANFLGQARMDAGDVVGALAAFGIALEASKARSDSTPQGLGLDQFQMAAALSANGRFDEALPYLDLAIESLQKGGGADSKLALRARSSRALLLARAGRLDDAERAFAALDKAPFTGYDAPLHLRRVAELRSLQGRHDEAIVLARSAVAELPKPPLDAALMLVDATLGSVLLAAGRPNEAIGPLRDSAALYAKKQIVISPDRAALLATLEKAEVQASSRTGGAPR